MKMYYENAYEIKEGSFYTGDVAIFSSDHYYNEGCTYEADFECIEMCLLEDEECAQRIAYYFNIDFDLADRLLSGHEEDLEVELCNKYDAYSFLQEVRGACAVKMGYDGCEDMEAQGTVYIVPMKGREKELTLVTEQ